MNQNIPTIGLILDFFKPHILEGAEAYCEKHQLRLDARWSVRGDWLPESPNWQGFIYSVVDMSELLTRLENWDIPKVSLIGDQASAVRAIPDYHACGELVGETLIQTGIHQLHITRFTKRVLDQAFVSGAESAAQAAQIPYQIIDFHEKFTFYEKITLLTQKIETSQLPLGLACPHSGVAYSLQNAVLKRSIRIPEDLVMCTVDIGPQRTYNFAPVPLTTVMLDEKRQGYLAAKKVHKLMGGEPPRNEAILVPPIGVNHRDSTRHTEKTDPIFEKALNYIRKNHLQAIGVNDVVEAAGASRRSVENRFREALNRGIHEELTRLRIKLAIRLLSDKKITITEIAEACGFSSVHYFSTVFKRETGVSPKAYQNRSE